MIEFLRGLLPTATELPWAGGGAIVAILLNSLFPIHDYLNVLAYAMVIDFVFGMFAAFVNPSLTLDSRKGWRGLMKKAAILGIVSFCSIAAVEFNASSIYYGAVGCYISVEILSIIENAGKAGIPVPEKLRKTLAQLAEEKTDKK